MPPTPTVISAQPLENTVRGYLERNDLIGLKPFLATQWAPDIADVLERLPGAQRDLAFTQLDPPLAAGVLAEVGTENKRDLLRLLSRDQLTRYCQVNVMKMPERQKKPSLLTLLTR